MYESPINLMVGDIEMQMVQKQEQTIFNAIRKCSVDVDKDELVKALNYDRNQYSKGYKDGVNDALNKVRVKVERLQKMCDKNDLNLLAQYSAFGMVLDIIDKHKTESEG